MGKNSLTTNCLKIKVDFKDSLFFTNRIIHEKLWKGNEGDVPWWQWQESSKKLQTQQNINKTQSEGDGGEWGETEWGQERQEFCPEISNNGEN